MAMSRGVSYVKRALARNFQASLSLKSPFSPTLESTVGLSRLEYKHFSAIGHLSEKRVGSWSGFQLQRSDWRDFRSTDCIFKRFFSSDSGEGSDSTPANASEVGREEKIDVSRADDEGSESTAKAVEGSAAVSHQELSAEDEEYLKSINFLEEYAPYPFPDDMNEADDDIINSMIIGEDVRGIDKLPPYEDIIGVDPNDEEKEERREAERKKEEEIARQRQQKLDSLGRASATGRRKTSTARVWLMEGEGKISVNGRRFDDVFPSLMHRADILAPFQEVERVGVFDVMSTVKGGGVNGQAQAIRHGISRALQNFDPSLRPALKAAGFITRDPRMVERKKPGKKKARKSFQWVKR